MTETENQVKSIAQLAAATLDIKKIDGTSIAFLPENFNINSLENFQAQPTRKKGTTQVQSEKAFLLMFDRYANKDSTLVYADRHQGAFKAVFNENTATEAGWADHSVTYSCPHSNEWTEWTKHDGVQMNQTEFAQFIERNLVDIVEPNSAEMLEISRELVARKSANFSSSIRLSNGSHQFHYDEEIKGATKSGNLEVPETFKIGIPVFLNGCGYNIEARLRYRIKEQQLQMWYELIRPHDVFEDAFNAVFERIEKETGMEIIEAYL